MANIYYYVLLLSTWLGVGLIPKVQQIMEEYRLGVGVFFTAELYLWQFGTC